MSQSRPTVFVAAFVLLLAMLLTFPFTPFSEVLIAFVYMLVMLVEHWLFFAQAYHP
jgi:hypothetical protein